jgi:predicted heme/steroid binding protein
LDAHFFTHTDLLSSYSGTGDQPTYIAVGDDVYDVSESLLWSGGTHMGQHLAGRDLTNGLAAAPHGPEVLDTFRKVGKLWRGAGTASLNALWGTFTGQAFLFLARAVLVIASLIILCVALWRWG